ncbi:MAG: polymer-forming cytoskeletal protein [Pseudomonadota bacterium]
MNMFTKKSEAGGIENGIQSETISASSLSSGPTTSPSSTSKISPTPAPSQRPSSSRESVSGSTIISSDLTIIGNVVSKGQVTLDGTIQGDMHCASLVVGENGEIDGGIIANEVVVHGRVTGAIRGDRVMLQKTAHVEGDIFHQEIGIEMGTVFDGTLKRTDKPTTMVQKPQINKVQ